MFVKCCSLCKTSQPIENFHKNARSSDGLCTECKSCKSNREKSRRQKNILNGPSIIRTHKVCWKCKVELPIDEFNKSRSESDGRQNTCKDCLVSIRQESYRKRKYNLNSSYIVTLLMTQRFMCLICTDKVSYKNVHIDHCHNTGKVRGLLCSNCNRGLGLFRDNTKSLSNAVDYLKNFYFTGVIQVGA